MASIKLLSQSKVFATSHKFSPIRSNGFRYFSNTAQPNPPIELQTTFSAPKDYTNTDEFFKNRKVLLVGIVGAFTGVCDNQLPPFAEKLEEFKSRGIDEVAVVSVNDRPVLKAFSKAINIDDKLTIFADFDGSFTRSLGMEVDLTTARLGKRSKRYAMIVDNGTIVKKWVEDKPSELKISSADNVLKQL